MHWAGAVWGCGGQRMSIAAPGPAGRALACSTPSPPPPPPLPCSYDAAKQRILRSGVTGGDNAWTHALSSACSGFVASVVSTPADVVKTRLMSQDPSSPTYRGMAHCLTATLRTGAGWQALCAAGIMSALPGVQRPGITPPTPSHAEGLRGLYSGFLPTWMRLAPWQLCFWVRVPPGRQHRAGGQWAPQPTACHAQGPMLPALLLQVSYEQLRKLSGLTGF